MSAFDLPGELTEIQRAEKHLETKLTEWQQAQVAKRDAIAKHESLQKELDQKLEEERVAAENDSPDAPALTAKVAELQGALRRAAHRIRKLETDEEMARIEWNDATLNKCRTELKDAREELSQEATALDSALTALREQFMKYGSACRRVGGLVVSSDTGNARDYELLHVAKLMRWHLIGALGDVIQFTGGKDHNGETIFSAADLRTEFGTTNFLLRG